METSKATDTVAVDLASALGQEAIEQLKAIREHRIYRGTDPDYRQRAKLAIGVIGAYVRLKATIANDRTNDLIERRLLKSEQPQLPSPD